LHFLLRDEQGAHAFRVRNRLRGFACSVIAKNDDSMYDNLTPMTRDVWNGCAVAQLHGSTATLPPCFPRIWGEQAGAAGTLGRTWPPNPRPRPGGNSLEAPDPYIHVKRIIKTWKSRKCILGRQQSEKICLLHYLRAKKMSAMFSASPQTVCQSPRGGELSSLRLSRKYYSSLRWLYPRYNGKPQRPLPSSTSAYLRSAQYGNC
jgi:hypothetical protein